MNRPTAPFPGSGEMSARMRAVDWGSSPLGHPERWSSALHTALGIILSSQHPMIIFWGPEHRCFYNDAYARALGAEQKAVPLGAKGADALRETWHVIGPQVDHVMRGMGATWHENQALPVFHSRLNESSYWTYGCSPIPDPDAPSGNGGVLLICTETTQQVLTEMRHKFLVELGDALRQHDDPLRIIATAIDAIGRFLGVSRVGYGQVCADDTHIELQTNYTDGVAPVIGSYPLTEFGMHNISRQRRGEIVVHEDVTLDPLNDAAKWAAIETRAVVSVPLIRDGRFCASLFVNDRQPRAWSANEIALIERVATRIWEAVQRAHAEAQLRLTTQRFELALHGSFVTLAYQDRELRYTWLYNRALQMSIPEAIGKTDAELFPAEDAALLAEIKRVVMRSRKRQRQTVSIRIQGTQRYFDLLVEPNFAPDGSVDGVRCASMDITERKTAELAVLDREARLATLADAMPQLVWIGRSDGELEYVNQRLCEYVGLFGDAAKSHDLWKQTIHPEDREQSIDVWSRATAKGEEYTLEQRWRRHDGVYRWFLVRAQPERDPEGRVIRWYGTSTDIDDAKRLERNLLAQEAALREVDARKDRFLATLSHELRNPLAPIRNAAQILGSAAVPPEQLRWAQAVIQRQVKHMSWLLDDLLDMARITQGKLELKKARVSLTSIVDAAVEAARPLLDKKQHHLVVDLPPEVPTLEADPLRLAQVVSNLLNNAAKYTDSGGRIELSARVVLNIVSITVRDSGIGIPPQSLDRIFDMFAQIDSQSSRTEGGLGIGLSLVKGLVELHGGTTEVASAGAGLGSEFTVNLPLPALDMDAAQTAAPDASPQDATGRRVLIADDNTDAADSLAILLEIDGHEVRVAHGGHAALALAQAFRPEVALLDIGMPELNGYEVATALRKEPWGKGMQLIALTGWGQESDRRHSNAAGFDWHLTKPIDMDTLCAVLKDRSSATRDQVQRLNDAGR
jgi:PAS domain S-box-containing protein